MRSSVFLRLIYLVFLLLPSRVLGLTIEVDSGAVGTPPFFIYDTTSSTPLSIPVTLYNESLSTTETVALWQLSLKIVKRNDANGDVEISGFETPDMPFLSSSGTGTIPPNALPNFEAVFIDADMPTPPLLPGKDILPGETRGLVNIELSSPNNATGIFYLVLGGFDPVGGSFWSGPIPPPSPFSNTSGSILPNEIVLAELVFVVPVPEPSTLGLLAVSLTALTLRVRNNFKPESTA